MQKRNKGFSLWELYKMKKTSRVRLYIQASENTNILNVNVCSSTGPLRCNVFLKGDCEAVCGNVCDHYIPEERLERGKRLLFSLLMVTHRQ